MAGAQPPSWHSADAGTPARPAHTAGPAGAGGSSHPTPGPAASGTLVSLIPWDGRQGAAAGRPPGLGDAPQRHFSSRHLRRHTVPQRGAEAAPSPSSGATWRWGTKSGRAASVAPLPLPCRWQVPMLAGGPGHAPPGAAGTVASVVPRLTQAAGWTCRRLSLHQTTVALAPRGRPSGVW